MSLLSISVDANLFSHPAITGIALPEESDDRLYDLFQDILNGNMSQKDLDQRVAGIQGFQWMAMSNGFTLLHHVTLLKRHDLIQHIVQKGGKGQLEIVADYDTRRTALYLAICDRLTEENYKTVQTLIECGSDVNVVCESGSTSHGATSALEEVLIEKYTFLPNDDNPIRYRIAKLLVINGARARTNGPIHEKVEAFRRKFSTEIALFEERTQEIFQSLQQPFPLELQRLIFSYSMD